MTELHTDRLVLRRWRAGDLDPLAAIYADPEVMRQIMDGSVRTRDETAASIAAMERHWDTHGFGLFATEVRTTGQLAGWVGLAVPGFLPEVMPAVEIGWRLGRSFWGAGLATEAAREVLRFAFDECDLDRVISIRDVGNDRSGRVMEKLGMTFDRHTEVPGNGQRVDVFAIERG